jgi:hypothetical protein
LNDEELRKLAKDTFHEQDKIYAAVDQIECVYQAFRKVAQEVAQSGYQPYGPPCPNREHSAGWWQGMVCTKCGRAG